MGANKFDRFRKNIKYRKTHFQELKKMGKFKFKMCMGDNDYF